MSGISYIHFIPTDLIDNNKMILMPVGDTGEGEVDQTRLTIRAMKINLNSEGSQAYLLCRIGDTGEGYT
jgi:hypothetical protein